jgi:FkbM family methyltransferase
LGDGREESVTRAGGLLMHAVKNALRSARRRMNQWRGRDVPFRRQVRVPRLHLGSDYGGWTVQPELLARESIVYSVGVGNDISFDLALILRFGCRVHAFDPTPKSVQWIDQQSLPEQFVFHPIGLADADGTARFVLPRADFVSFHIGQEQAAAASDVVECPVQRLTTITRSLGHARIDLLKMDIEGAEYAVIDDLLKSGVPIAQLLIEFHHVIGDQPSLQRTRQAIESLNAVGYRIFDISPVGFEYSFIRP